MDAVAGWRTPGRGRRGGWGGSTVVGLDGINCKDSLAAHSPSNIHTKVQIGGDSCMMVCVCCLRILVSISEIMAVSYS